MSQISESKKVNTVTKANQVAKTPRSGLYSSINRRMYSGGQVELHTFWSWTLEGNLESVYTPFALHLDKEPTVFRQIDPRPSPDVQWREKVCHLRMTPILIFEKQDGECELIAMTARWRGFPTAWTHFQIPLQQRISRYVATICWPNTLFHELVILAWYCHETSNKLNCAVYQYTSVYMCLMTCAEQICDGTSYISWYTRTRISLLRLQTHIQASSVGTAKTWCHNEDQCTPCLSMLQMRVTGFGL